MISPKVQLRTVIIALLVVLWAVLVIALYFVLHRPWGAGQLPALLRAGLDATLALALASLAGGLGRRVLRPVSGLRPLEHLALSLALGLGVLGLVVLAAGMAGLFQPWLAWAALLVGLALLHRDVFGWLAGWRSVLPKAGRLSRFEKMALGFILFLAVLNLARALAPPIKWDSLVYHLQAPRQYLAAGRIFFYPENFYAGFPQIAGMCFSWAMLLGSERTAAVLGWIVGMTAFVGVEGFARRLAGHQPRWLAPAVLMSGLSLSQSLSWAYVDLWVMLFGLGMLVALELYRQSWNRKWLILTAVMVGFAVGVKYTAAVLFAIAGVYLLLARPPGGIRRLFTDLVLAGGLAFLVFSPWLVKNWTLADNPLYPFVSFEAQVNPWRQAFRSGEMPQRSLWSDLLLPYEATIYGIESAIVIGKPEYSASLGPLMLALIPGLLAGWRPFDERQRRGLKILLGVAAASWVMWALAAHFADELMRPRHYYGIFPALAVLAAAGFRSAAALELPGIRLRRILGALVTLALGLTAIAEANQFLLVNPLPVVAGFQGEQEYLEGALGEYASAIQAVNELPPGSQALFLWEPRTFYCQGICLPDGKLDNWWALQQSGGDVEGILHLLQEKGVTHVLLSSGGLDFAIEAGLLDPAGQEAWKRLSSLSLQPVWEAPGRYILFEVIAP